MSVHCTCGYHVEGIEDVKRAEVLADAHESRYMLRANRHHTEVVFQAGTGKTRGLATLLEIAKEVRR